MNVSADSHRRTPVHSEANALLWISLVAVLNCPEASGLHALKGPTCFVLLGVAKSALFNQIILIVQQFFILSNATVIRCPVHYSLIDIIKECLPTSCSCVDPLNRSSGPCGWGQFSLPVFVCFPSFVPPYDCLLCPNFHLYLHRSVFLVCIYSFMSLPLVWFPRLFLCLALLIPVFACQCSSCQLCTLPQLLRFSWKLLFFSVVLHIIAIGNTNINYFLIQLFD